MASSPSPSQTSTLVESCRTSLSTETLYTVASLLVQKADSLRKEGKIKDNATTSLDDQRQRAIHFQNDCDFEQAQNDYESIYRYCKEYFGDGDLRTLTATEDVAVNLAHRGQYEESQMLFQQVLEQHQIRREQNRLGYVGIRRETRQEQHLAIARAYYNLGNVLNDQNFITEAALSYRQAFSLRRKYLGISHHDSLTSLMGLAGTYISKGRFDRAQKLLKQVDDGYRLLESGTGQLASNADSFLPDRNTISVYLLSVSQSQAIIHDLRGGKEGSARAEELFVLAWNRIQQHRPLQHPDVLEVAANLAAYYDHQGRLEEAEEFYVRAMARADSLGPLHPLTLSTKRKLSMVRERSRVCWPPLGGGGIE